MPPAFRQKFKEHLRANIVAYFFMTLIFLVGVVVGALAVKTLPEDQKLELAGYLKIFFQGLVQETANTSDVSLFSNILINNFKAIALMWLFGFTVIGIPLVLFIVFTRGFVIGFTVGFLVNEYVAKGLAFALAAILPHNFFSVPAVLVAGVSAMSYSLLLVRRRFRGKISLLYEAMRYTAVCLVMLAVMVVASIVEVYISPVFMKLVAGLLVNH
ncbi:MAG: stage sporulation protein [Firmicutes bacterium]|nr:stage sporulation protein [Bacillota bacterium]